MNERWTSDARTITEADIIQFAGFSGDWNSLHIDQEYAKQGPFGKRIAHGLLVLSIASGRNVFGSGKAYAFYGIDHLRFIQPVYVGDTIHVEMTVEKIEEKMENAGLLTVKQQVVKQNGETAIVSTIKVLINKRHSPFGK